MLDPKQVKGSLYDPRFEQDSCGVGFVARPSASPSRDIVEMALQAVANLTHRGAVDADAKTGDSPGPAARPGSILQAAAQRRGLRVLGWRRVPLDRSALGDKALAPCPNVAQL